MNAPDASDPTTEAPLIVDLDGTLIRTDLLHESIVLMLLQQPWLLFSMPRWLLGGKAFVKSEVASRVLVDAGIVMTENVISAAARQIALATASCCSEDRRAASREIARRRLRANRCRAHGVGRVCRRPN